MNFTAIAMLRHHPGDIYFCSRCEFPQVPNDLVPWSHSSAKSILPFEFSELPPERTCIFVFRPEQLPLTGEDHGVAVIIGRKQDPSTEALANSRQNAPMILHTEVHHH